jgi:hypothetical protein
MTTEQCARELANLLQSGPTASASSGERVDPLLPQRGGARQRDLKRHQLVEAFKEMVPDSEHRDLILRRILPDDH